MIIRNGLVALEDRVATTDIRTEGSRIVEVGRCTPHGDEEILDAAGRVVLPGFIDVHTHLDDTIGGYPLADGYSSGSRCAIANGVTTLAAFVTETEDIPLEDGIRAAAGKASGQCYCDYWWHITPIRFDDDGWVSLRSIIARGFRSLKLYTTYRQAGLYLDYDQLGRVFASLAREHVQFLVHCEDDAILAGARLRDGEWNSALAFAQSRPPEAEMIAVREVLRRARQAGVRVHVVHVSTPEAAVFIRQAGQGGDVTCETAPQYLFLDERQLARKDGHRWICAPPLRPPQLREALVRAVQKGACDVFATDHCAFLRGDKDTMDNGLQAVPGGVAGIGALPHLVRALYGRRLPDALPDFVRRLSTNPARLLGVYPRKGVIAPGSDADLVIASLDAPPRPVRSSYAEVHETYPDFQSTLSIDTVVLRGEQIVSEGRLVNGNQPRGTSLWPM